MKNLAELLENFDGFPTPGQEGSGSAMLSETELENIRLAAFDNGYRAGWDDAASAHEAEQRHIASDLAQNLRDLSFTYNEAALHAVRALAPLMATIVGKVLPATARTSMAPFLKDLIELRARTMVSGPLTIVVSPEDKDRLTPLLDQDFGFPVTLETDPGFISGQADLRFGSEETALDLGRTADEITAAIAGLIDTMEEDAQHAEAG